MAANASQLADVAHCAATVHLVHWTPSPLFVGTTVVGSLLAAVLALYAVAWRAPRRKVKFT
jgi:hypothetical protein